MSAAMMLDTSAYSAFKRGHAEVIAALRRARPVLVPAIVVGELLAGFARSALRERNERELAAFLGRARIREVPITHDTADRYATIHAALRAAGTPIPTNDMWIAASAMEHGAELMTLDGDFASVPQILVRQFELSR